MKLFPSGCEDKTDMELRVAKRGQEDRQQDENSKDKTEQG